jgi:hypothetical protein
VTCPGACLALPSSLRTHISALCSRSEAFGKQLQLVGTPLEQLHSPDFEWFDPTKHGMDHLKALTVAKRSSQLMGDGGAHLSDQGGPLHLLPEEACTHVGHCGAHKGSLSMQESPVTADIAAKLETCAKFLRAGDHTPSVQLHMRIICGFDDIPEDAPDDLCGAYEACRQSVSESSREPLMFGDFEGSVALTEIEKGFSIGNSIRWEYHCETNARFWALRYVLPHAIRLQWQLGVHEYDWGKTKAHEVYSILSDPINLFYMAILRVDELLMYGSCFQVYQMKGDIASRHVSGPEAVWMSYRNAFQEQLRYVKIRANRKGPDGKFMHRLNGSRLRHIVIPRSTPLQDRLMEIGCGHTLSSTQVASTLANHFRCRLRGMDRYFSTEAFSSHALIQAMMHEDIIYDSDCEKTRKPLYAVPSERALHAASILVQRAEGTAGHWSKQARECCSYGSRAEHWQWAFAGKAVVADRQLCTKIYQPCLTFYERPPRTHLEKGITTEPYAFQLQTFAEGASYYIQKRNRSRFRFLQGLNPRTNRPWPLRKFAGVFEMLISGLAGVEMIGSGHIERCMSTFTAMAGSRKRNVREPAISLEVRSPTYIQTREEMGKEGWSRVFDQCLPLQRRLKAGFYIGDQAAAFMRKLTARQRRARKRDKAIDYLQKDRRGQFLFDHGLAATGKKRKHTGKDQQKAAAQAFYGDDSSDSTSQGADDDVGDSAAPAGPSGVSSGDWDPDGGQCEECMGLEECSKVAACIGCGVVHCESCIEELGELQNPFCCSGCISDDDSQNDSDVDDDSAIDEDLPCSVCNRSDDDANMLICDGCSEGYHLTCLGLKAIPDTAEWYCTDCSTVVRAETWLKRKKLNTPE